MAKRGSAKPKQQRKKRGGSAPAPTLSDDQKRESFLHHRTAWNGWQGKVKALAEIEKGVKKALKADGFTVEEFKVADDLTTVKGEAKVKASVETRLRVAAWIGHPMGAQMDLFAKNAKTMTRNPYDEGKQASMENKPKKPPAEYAIGSDQWAKWIEGYDEHQASIVPGGPVSRAGFKEGLADIDATGKGVIAGRIGQQPGTATTVESKH